MNDICKGLVLLLLAGVGVEMLVVGDAMKIELLGIGGSLIIAILVAKIIGISIFEKGGVQN